MSRPEENIDQLIRAALNQEEAEAYDNLGEQSVFEEAFGVLRGKNRFIIRMTVVFSFVFFLIGVFAGFQFFDAIETNDLILWSVVFMTSMTGVGMLKMWYWMEMEKNATIREIKRVQLQVAHLAKVMEGK